MPFIYTSSHFWLGRIFLFGNNWTFWLNYNFHFCQRSVELSDFSKSRRLLWWTDMSNLILHFHRQFSTQLRNYLFPQKAFILLLGKSRKDFFSPSCVEIFTVSSSSDRMPSNSWLFARKPRDTPASRVETWQLPQAAEYHDLVYRWLVIPLKSSETKTLICNLSKKKDTQMMFNTNDTPVSQHKGVLQICDTKKCNMLFLLCFFQFIAQIR